MTTTAQNTVTYKKINDMMNTVAKAGSLIRETKYTFQGEVDGVSHVWMKPKGYK